MVAASAEHGGKRPIKLGHDPRQRLARASGFKVSDDDPGLGWVENLRVDGDQLLGDLKAVPRKLAGLIRVGAFRRRSVELRRLASGWAITALSLQGAKAPALDTLDDIVKLYEEETTVEGLRTIDSEIEGAEGVIPEGRLAFLSEDEELVSSSRLAELEAAAGEKRPPADIGAMADLTLKEEAQRKLAAALGLEGDVDEAKLLEGAEARKTELKQAQEKATELESKTRELEESDVTKRLEAAEGQVKKLEEERRVEKREALITAAVKDGRIEPGAKEAWQKDYDEAPEVTTRHLEALEPDEDLTRELGDDRDGLNDEDDEAREKRDLAEREEIARTFDLEKEEVA